MLGWLTGRGTSNSNRDDEVDSPEYPETPAPIFAARAFKSAIFGTPAPKDDDTFEIAKAANTAARETGSMSPTKRGILMTPGTATTRRKTVTFGVNIEHELKKDSKSGIPDDCPGKFPSPWVSKGDDTLPVPRRTNLTQTLENARESTKKSTSVSLSGGKSDSESPFAKDVQPLPRLEFEPRVLVNKRKEVEPKKGISAISRAEDPDLDFTVDLNDPRSQSGRHWKREYEKYHEEAQERMGHLMRYKELAKDYAKIKDDEAMELREQLEQEQQNVISMESYIAKLVSAIDDRSKSGNSDVTPEMTKELARQTALAVQYKLQVEQFRAALEKGGVVQAVSGRHANSSSKAERALADARQDLERLKDQLKETNSLHSEVKRLKLDLTISERKSTKLKEENLTMAQQLEQCRADLERSEGERHVQEEQAKKRGEILQTLQKDYESLKQLAKKQRSDADLVLEQRREQVTTLRKELRSSGRHIADSSESEKLIRTLQQKIAAHDKIVQEYEVQITRLRSQEVMDLDHFNLENDPKQPKRNSSLRKVFGGSSNRGVGENESLELTKDTDFSLQRDDTEQPDQTINVDRFLDSVMPELRTPSFKPDSPQKENRSMLPMYTHSTTPRSSPAVLKEIVNSTPKAGASKIREPFDLITPDISKKFADLSLDSPALAPPSISRPTYRARTPKPSPGPTMFNYENTPVKSSQAPDMAGVAQGPSRPCLVNKGSPRARRIVAPERAAAAKARLEQRKTERQLRRMQETA